jgi:hypothetical protein
MKKNRLPLQKLIEIEQALSSLPHPLRVEREGTGPVKVMDEEGNSIRVLAYSELQTLLYFIQKNCPHK